MDLGHCGGVAVRTVNSGSGAEHWSRKSQFVCCVELDLTRWLGPEMEGQMVYQMEPIPACVGTGQHGHLVGSVGRADNGASDEYYSSLGRWNGVEMVFLSPRGV